MVIGGNLRNNNIKEKVRKLRILSLIDDRT